MKAIRIIGYTVIGLGIAIALGVLAATVWAMGAMGRGCL